MTSRFNILTPVVISLALLVACSTDGGGGGGGGGPTAPPGQTLVNVTMGPFQNLFGGSIVSGTYSVPGGPAGDLVGGEATFMILPGTYAVRVQGPGFVTHTFSIEVPEVTSADFGRIFVFERLDFNRSDFDRVARPSKGIGGARFRNGTVRWVTPPTIQLPLLSTLRQEFRAVADDLAGICDTPSSSIWSGATIGTYQGSPPRWQGSFAVVVEFDSSIPGSAAFDLSIESGTNNIDGALLKLKQDFILMKDLRSIMLQIDGFYENFGAAGRVDTILNVPPLTENYTRQDENWCQAKNSRQPGAQSPDDTSQLEPLKP